MRVEYRNSGNRLAVGLHADVLGLDGLDLPQHADAQPESGGA